MTLDSVSPRDRPASLHIRGFHDLVPFADLCMEVARASERHRLFYIEQFEGGWRWSFASGGGPYSLTRVIARHLGISHNQLAVRFEALEDGSVIARPVPSEEPPLLVRVLRLEGPTEAEQIADRLEQERP
jgi:hypothetical protein